MPAASESAEAEDSEARRSEESDAGDAADSGAGDSQASGSDVVDDDEARRLVAAGEAVVFDLREDDDWIAGHIPGANHVAEDELDDRLEEVSEDRKVLVVCEDGERSAEVAASLRDKGCDAVSLDGGMKAWNSRYQPSSDPG